MDTKQEIANEVPGKPTLTKMHGVLRSKLTTYSRPSLETLMTHCLDKEQLDKFYQRVLEGAKDASPKTLRRWKASYELQTALLAQGHVNAQVQQARDAQLKAFEEGSPLPAPLHAPEPTD
jgi:hypothetical protein